MDSLQKNASEALGTRVYNALCASLRNGDLRSGDRVREEEVARQLGVSRTPVREAFGRLQARGLLTAAGGRGLVVRRLEVRDVMELYTMREIIEGASAALAADHASAMEIETLNELNAAFGEAACDPKEMARLNRLFHEAIYRAARNQYLDLALSEIQDSIGLLGTTTFIVPGRPERAVEEHRAMIDAIARRDGKTADELARSHIRGALSARMRLLQEKTRENVT